MWRDGRGFFGILPPGPNLSPPAKQKRISRKKCQRERAQILMNSHQMISDRRNRTGHTSTMDLIQDLVNSGSLVSVRYLLPTPLVPHFHSRLTNDGFPVSLSPFLFLRLSQILVWPIVSVVSVSLSLGNGLSPNSLLSLDWI